MMELCWHLLTMLSCTAHRVQLALTDDLILNALMNAIWKFRKTRPTAKCHYTKSGLYLVISESCR